MSLNAPTKSANIFADLRSELHRVIVGQDYLIERLMVALIADGHVLLEGVPGLAKTKTLTALTTCIDAHMARIQFTPDLLPSDLIGTEVYRPQSGDFTIRKGPIFTNLLLADEINRAPAKVQSALLQAMQEREVTLGEHTFQLPTPFLVLATQNPIEQEGTYQLPEAQLDRFLMKVKVGYPSFEDELRIVELSSQKPLTDGSPSSANGPSPTTEHGAAREGTLRKIIPISKILALRADVHTVFVDPKIDRYVVSLVQATRQPAQHNLQGLIEWGASPRASIALKSCARALALIRGRTFVTPEEVKEIAPDVLRHRVVTTFEAEARSVSSDEIVQTLLKSVKVP